MKRPQSKIVIVQTNFYNKLSGIDKKGEMLYDAFHSVLSMAIGFSSSYNKNASVRFTLTNQLSERHWLFC